jgi:hypothetical protein
LNGKRPEGPTRSIKRPVNYTEEPIKYSNDKAVLGFSKKDFNKENKNAI